MIMVIHLYIRKNILFLWKNICGKQLNGILIVIKVVCINIGKCDKSILPYDNGLTVGKIYEVEYNHIDNTKYEFIDDDGDFKLAFKERFITMEEYREKQLDILEIYD